jgi:hypothetical protein
MTPSDAERRQPTQKNRCKMTFDDANRRQPTPKDKNDVKTSQKILNDAKISQTTPNDASGRQLTPINAKKFENDTSMQIGAKRRQQMPKDAR